MTGMFRNMGGNIPGGNFSRGNFPGGEFDGWEYSRWEFSWYPSQLEKKLRVLLLSFWKFNSYFEDIVGGFQLIKKKPSLKVYKQILLRTRFFHIIPLVAISELRVWKGKKYIHKILNSKWKWRHLNKVFNPFHTPWFPSMHPKITETWFFWCLSDVFMGKRKGPMTLNRSNRLVYLSWQFSFHIWWSYVSPINSWN